MAMREHGMVFFKPRVQGRIVDVVDLLVRCHAMIQLNDISASSAKGVARVERFHELQGVHVRLDIGIGLLEFGPLTFPHFDDVVPFLEKICDFGVGLFVDILHGEVTETQMLFMVYGITLGTRARNTHEICTRYWSHNGNRPRCTWSRGSDTRQHSPRVADGDDG